MSILTLPLNARRGTDASRLRVDALLGHTGLRTATVAPGPDVVLVTVATLADLAGWLEELGGAIAFADGPAGFRIATLTTRTPESPRGSVEVRVAVVYPAGSEDEDANWHQLVAGIGVSA